MNYATLDDFIRDLPVRAMDAREQLRGHDALFFLNTREGRRVAVTIRDGGVTLSEQAGAPDCTVTASEIDLLRLVNGELSPAKALLFGKVRVSGDPTKLMSLIRVMNG